jgi:hypothetical protein
LAETFFKILIYFLNIGLEYLKSFWYFCPNKI